MYIDNSIKIIVKIINEGIRHEDLINYIRNKSNSVSNNKSVNNNKNDCQFLIDFNRTNISVNGKVIDREKLNDVSYNIKINSIKDRDREKEKALDVMNSDIFGELEVKPDKIIMNELIMNCHQGGYDGCLYLILYNRYRRLKNNIQCLDVLCVNDETRNISFNLKGKRCLQVTCGTFFTLLDDREDDKIIHPKIQSMIKFDLEVDKKGQVIYKNIKLSYKIPKFFSVIDTSNFTGKVKMKLIEYLSKIPIIGYRDYDMKIYDQDNKTLFKNDKRENKSIFSVIVEKILQFVNRIFNSKTSEKSDEIDKMSVSSVDSAFSSEGSIIDESCSDVEEQSISKKCEMKDIISDNWQRTFVCSGNFDDKDDHSASSKVSVDTEISEGSIINIDSQKKRWDSGIGSNDFQDDSDDNQNAQITKDNTFQIAPNSKLNNSRTANIIDIQSCSRNNFI